MLVGADQDNAIRVYRALAEFGAPIEAFDVRVEDFATYEGVLQIGVQPFRVDILTSISGVTFSEARKDSGSFEVDGRTVPVIGRAALLANKRAAGRPQDVADLDALESSEPGS